MSRFPSSYLSGILLLTLVSAPLADEVGGFRNFDPSVVQEAPSEHSDEHGSNGSIEPVHKVPSIKPLPLEGPLRIPVVAMREIQILQDDVALGVKGSLKRYRNEIQKRSIELLALPDKVWGYKENVVAAGFLVLVGANPKIGRHALKHVGTRELGGEFIEFANAYATNRFDRAREFLETIDDNSMPPLVRAQLSIIRSMLHSTDDPDGAIAELKAAIYLAPGTLAEEAAFRRLLRIAAKQTDMKLFELSVRNYLSRFKNSLYFKDFTSNFLLAVARFPESDYKKIMKISKDVLHQLTPDQAKIVFGSVARIAVFSGQQALAKWSSTVALKHVDPETKLHARFQLYHLAATIDELDQHTTNLQVLENLESKLTEPEDIKLQAFVVSLLSNIHQGYMSEEELGVPLPKTGEEMAPSRNANEKQKAGESVTEIEDNKPEGHPIPNPTLVRAHELVENAVSAMKGANQWQ